MALMKRAGAAIAGGALVALTACAPTPANPNNAAGVKPVANAGAESTPEPSASPTPEPVEVADVNLADGLIGKKVARMGQVVTDDKGFVLYRFDKDSAKPSKTTCVGDCARVWPPVLTDGKPDLKGIADDRVGTVTRPDGTRQVTIGDWPVYRYIGDEKPGQWRGQGVAGTWFVVTPTGTKNLSCLPKGTPKAVAPPPVEDAQGGDTGGPSY